MKNLKYYLNKARKEGWAIGQFNFSTFEQAKGIVEAAKNLKSPIILGTSEGESKFFGLEEAVAIRNVLRRGSGRENIPVFLNLDHGKSFDYLKQAIDAGYDMVHFDGSKLALEDSPRGEAGNIKITKEVVRYAKWRGVLVEGEVGRLATDSSRLYSEKFEIKEEDLTKPLDVEKYINKTGADLLAPSIGNFHGMEVSGINPNLRLDILENIKKKTKQEFLVLHGGSGIPKEDIKKAIGLGIVKININTELRLAFSESLRKALADNPEEITPYKYLQKPIEAVKIIVEEKILLFYSNGKN